MFSSKKEMESMDADLVAWQSLTDNKLAEKMTVS